MAYAASADGKWYGFDSALAEVNLSKMEIAWLVSSRPFMAKYFVINRVKYLK